MHDFSIHDVRFRRTAKHECKIVVFGQTVGAVHRHADRGPPDHPGCYAIQLYDTDEAPRFVDRRGQIRLAIADWLWTGNLVPIHSHHPHAAYAPPARAPAS